MAKVFCDLGEPARDHETNETYCFVELHFHVARVEVKCCEYYQSPRSFSGVVAELFPHDRVFQ